MNNKYKKRLLAIIILVVLSLLLTGCHKKQEDIPLGKIGNVDLEEYVPEDYSEQNYFEDFDAPFGYKFVQTEMPRIRLKVNTPKDYSVNVVNARHLELNSPDSDTALPGITIHLLCDIRAYAENRTEVDKYGELFAGDALGLNYYIDGKDYHPAYTIEVNEKSTDSRYSETTKTKVTTSVIKDAFVVHQLSGDSYRGKVNEVHVYANWQDQPVLLSCVCKEKYTDSVKELLNYMVSTFEYIPDSYTQVKTVEYDGISLSVPIEFENLSENVWVSPFRGASLGTSGLAVGIFKSDYDITEELLKENVDTVGAAFLPGMNNNMYFIQPSEQKTKQIGSKKSDYYWIQGTILLDYEPEGDFYRAGQTCYMNAYVIHADSGSYMIVSFFLDDQLELEDKLEELLCKSAKF